MRVLHIIEQYAFLGSAFVLAMIAFREFTDVGEDGSVFGGLVSLFTAVMLIETYRSIAALRREQEAGKKPSA